MTIHGTETADLPPLVHEALGWVVRLTSGAATTADAEAFEAWRAQGPAHVEAFREAIAFRRTLRTMPLSRLAPGSNVVAFERGSRPAVLDRRAMLIGGGAVAASAAMLMATPPYGLWPSLAELGAGERTGVGERRTLRPMAGVTVEMNARTALSLVQFSARLITGEAFVAVRSSQSPFSIVVGGKTWSTRNAELNVRFSDGNTCIACLRGSVRQSGDGVHTLGANQQYVSKAGEAGQISPIDAQISAAWRRGVLIFRDTPLAEAIDSINRYRPGRIILANERIGRRLVSGMFHTNQIENAVDQLQQLLLLQVTQIAGGVVILR
ncbi:FecR family protein [Sphingomonas psychrotolerans]|uniref:FecR family protein n=1 Tax=Sphingomonas psychrotolerans TaxID=1327635 RepID=A0A2K8MK18_9SPHN|nr:DUF4880 domain-containing protein [Sphingomonas psychrotolerans]ATY34195.1 hypothetical protein CVN68_21390 [Sphingomonas psychrotolerans]